MDGFNRPELTIFFLGAIVVCAGCLWRWIASIKEMPVHPDPWDAETERQLQESDAVPVCHHCFTPCPPRGWFCENCGCSVGPYNNLMPYVYIFSEGEVLRNGISKKVPANFVTVAGYFLMSLDYLMFLPLLPIFWFRLIRNWAAPHPEDAHEEDSTPTS